MEKQPKKIGAGTLVLIILLCIIITAIATVVVCKYLNKDTTTVYQQELNDSKVQQEEKISLDETNKEETKKVATENTIQNTITEQSKQEQAEKIVEKVNPLVSDIDDESVTYTHIKLNGKRVLVKVKQSRSQNGEESLPGYQAYNNKVQVSINGKDYKNVETLLTFDSELEVAQIETIQGTYPDKNAYIVLIIERTPTSSSDAHHIYVLDSDGNVIKKIEDYGTFTITDEVTNQSIGTFEFPLGITWEEYIRTDLKTMKDDWGVDREGKFINGVFFFKDYNNVCACEYPVTLNSNMSKANYIQKCSYLDMNSFDIAARNWMCDLINGEESVKKTDENTILINGEIDKTKEPIINKVLELLDIDYPVKIKQDIQLPVGCGFGTSACQALGVSIGLCDDFLKAGQIAHLAEVNLGSGLGDVIAQTGKGMVLRTKPGDPDPYRTA